MKWRGTSVSGVHYMIIGGIILVLSAVGIILTEWILGKRKKQLREQTYQIYE